MLRYSQCSISHTMHLLALILIGGEVTSVPMTITNLWHGKCPGALPVLFRAWGWASQLTQYHLFDEKSHRWRSIQFVQVELAPKKTPAGKGSSGDLNSDFLDLRLMP